MTVRASGGHPKNVPENELEPTKFNPSQADRASATDRVWIWGVPFTPFSAEQAVSAIDDLVQAGVPRFIITANVHYAMLCHECADLRAINEQAAFIVADGAPLVWASGRKRTPLPERVAGSDLITELGKLAARKGYRVFLLGGAEGVGTQAAEFLCNRFPGLQIAGVESPPFRELTAVEHDALIARIRAARADILLTAFTMPRGELWLAANCQLTGVPVSANIGAGIDFAAGTKRPRAALDAKVGTGVVVSAVARTPAALRRYASNALFIARITILEAVQSARGTGTAV